jgi:putative peptidoglycan lipid II flippase
MQRSMMKSAGMVTILLLLSRLFGFARESAIAYRFGAGGQTDAYFMAATIPALLFLAFNDSVKTAFIPVYGEFHNKEEGNSFALTVFVILAVILFVISAVMLLFTPQIMRLVALGYKDKVDQFELTVTLTRIMVPGLLFMGLSGLSSGVLHIKKNFFIPAITAFPNNLIIIITALFLGIRYGIVGLAWATLAGFALQFLVQFPTVAKHGVFSPRKLMWWHPGIKQMAILLPPVIIGGAAVELKTLVDRTFGTLLPLSSISSLNYANKIHLLPNGIIVLALLTVIYPTLVELYSHQKITEFKETLRQGVGLMITLMFPIMIGMMVLSVPMVRLLFERGKFTSVDTQSAAFALVFYSLGLLPMGVMLLFNRAFYATKDTKTPMYFTFVTMILNIFLNWLLMKPLGHGGLALGTSISIYVGAIGMGYLMWKKIGAFGGSRIMDTLWKSGAAAFTMGVVIWFGVPFLQGGGFILQAAQLGLVITVGAAIYFAFAYFLKIEELDLALAMVRRRFQK